MTAKNNVFQMTLPTMPNNILVGSEKLFRTNVPWRINKSLLGMIGTDHDMILFEQDYTETKTRLAKRLSKIIFNKAQRQYNKMIFIGLEDDTIMLVELAKLGFKFDAAFLINNKHDPKLFQTEEIFAHTAIYNFYTNRAVNNFFDKGYNPFDIQGAEVNQYTPTLLPAHISSRLAAEVWACLVYGVYKQNSLGQNPATLTFVTVN